MIYALTSITGLFLRVQTTLASTTGSFSASDLYFVAISCPWSSKNATECHSCTQKDSSAR